VGTAKFSASADNRPAAARRFFNTLDMHGGMAPRHN
jgi:hypothetical protein